MHFKGSVSTQAASCNLQDSSAKFFSKRIPLLPKCWDTHWLILELGTHLPNYRYGDNLDQRCRLIDFQLLLNKRLSGYRYFGRWHFNQCVWGYYFHHLIFRIIWQVIEQAKEKITITQNWPCNFIDNYLFSSNHITTS